MAWCSEMVLCHSSWWLRTIDWLPFWLKCVVLSTNKHQGRTKPASIKRVCLSNLLSHLAAVNTKWPCRRDRRYRHYLWSDFKPSGPHTSKYLSLFQRSIQDWCRWADTIPTETQSEVESPVSPGNPPLFGDSTGHSSRSPVQSLPGGRRQRGREKKGGKGRFGP